MQNVDNVDVGGEARGSAEETTLNALEGFPVVCRARVRLLFTAHQTEAA